MKNLIRKIFILSLVLGLIIVQDLHAAAGFWPEGKKSYAKFEYKSYNYSTLKDPIDDQITTEGRIFIDELDGELGFRWQANKKGWLQTRLITGWFNMDFSNFDGAEEPEFRFERMNSVDLELAYRGYYGGPVGLQVRAQPGSAAEAYDVNLWEEGFTMTGGAWVMWYQGDTLTAGLGVSHNYNFGRPLYMASMILEYHSKNEKWRGQAELPVLAEGFYRWSEKLEVGMTFKIDGNQYANEKEDHPGFTDPKVGHAAYNLAIAAGMDLDETMRVQVELGTNLKHTLRLYDGDDEKVNSDLDPRETLRISFIFGGDRE